MRGYVQNVAYGQQAFGRFDWINRTMSNWRMRKTIRTMLQMDCHRLKDIGLTRADLDSLLRLSNQVDLTREAERMVFLSTRLLSKVSVNPPRNR